MTNTLLLSDFDRQCWQGQVSSARRMLKRGYPTMAVEPALIIAVGEHLDVVESRLDFHQSQARVIAGWQPDAQSPREC